MKPTTWLLIPLAILLAGCAEEPEIRDEIFGAGIPDVVIDSVGTPRATQVTVYSNVLRENGTPVTGQGLQWRLESSPQDYSHSDSLKAPDAGKGAFSLVLRALKNSTAYYVRAYARNKIGIRYSEESYFTTREGLGAVETLDPKDVRAGSFVLAGRILRPGEGEILRRGFYYSTVSLTSPDVPKDSLLSDMKTDSFACTLEDRRPSTTYYVQAFLTNSFGTVLGNEKTVTTLDGRSIISLPPQIVTVGYTEATLQGNITDAGEAPVTERGFCYSTDHPEPNIDSGDTLRCGDGQGVFKSSLKGLLPNTRYYVRVYAVNKYGVAYGPTTTLHTLNEQPEVITAPLMIEQPGVVRVAGEVTNLGSGTLPVAGICWSVNPLPTVDDRKVLITQGLGAFDTLLYTMKGGFTYYVRAFVQNDVITTYGEQQILETPPVFSSVASYGGSLRTVRSASYVTLGSKGYVLGGDDGLSMLNELYVYDPDRGWSQQRAYADRRSWMMTAAVAGGETKDVIVAYGGMDGNNLVSDNFNYYDPTFNSWHEIEYEAESFPGTMYGGAGCARGSEVYFIGGVRRSATGDVITNSVWTVNPMDRSDDRKCVWVEKNSFPESFYGGFAAVVNDTLYAGLGLRTSGATPIGNRKLHFSADGGLTWENLPEMPGNSLYLAGVVHDKNIYVADTDGYLWLFYTAQRTWLRKSRLPETWWESVHCMFSLNGYIYFGFGKDRNSTLRYFPQWDVMD
ncbi:MAG: hypothetical protein LBU08_01285 [Tannerellaceae bacterium]|jgi:hypothetical protein|nr:hypothetical protein [Tannerellaceae bacterium]